MRGWVDDLRRRRILLNEFRERMNTTLRYHAILGCNNHTCISRSWIDLVVQLWVFINALSWLTPSSHISPLTISLLPHHDTVTQIQFVVFPEAAGEKVFCYWPIKTFHRRRK